ncbi:hypothetical protein [Aeromonas dhakensis]|uniref:hypothetical protein n=1 Tax=Aeromonas dhakensis TaxID=196024 RepID=UPI003F7AE395
MIERKFKYQKPKSTEERVEAIYEELCSSSSSNNNKKTVETLKEHVVALLTHSKDIEWRKKRDREEDSNSIQSALFTLAFIAIVFLWNGWWNDSTDWEWLNNHQFALRLWGTAFAAVYIGVSIERSSLFKRLWSFGFTKLVASIAVSALIVFSTGKSSSLINAVFGVDASVFPFTRAFIAGMLAFQYSSPLLVVVGFFAVLHAFDVAGYIKSKISSDYVYVLPPWQSLLFLVFAIIVLLASWRWINSDFSESAFPAKIYRLAHVLDFNQRHSCINIKEGVSVVFVGSDQSKVLVDMSRVQTEDIESFVNNGISGNVAIPNNFLYLPCNPGIRPQ